MKNKVREDRIRQRNEFNENNKELVSQIEELTDFLTQSHEMEHIDALLERIDELVHLCWKYDGRYTAYMEQRMRCLGRDYGDETAVYNDESVVQQLKDVVRDIRHDYKDSRAVMGKNKEYIEQARRIEHALSELGERLSVIARHVAENAKFIRRQDVTDEQAEKALHCHWEDAISNMREVRTGVKISVLSTNSVLERFMSEISILSETDILSSAKCPVLSRLISTKVKSLSMYGAMKILSDVHEFAPDKAGSKFARFMIGRNYENKDVDLLFNLVYDYQLREQTSFRGRHSFSTDFCGIESLQAALEGLYNYMIEKGIGIHPDGHYHTRRGRKTKAERERSVQTSYYFIAVLELVFGPLTNYFKSMWDFVLETIGVKGFLLGYKEAKKYISTNERRGNNSIFQEVKVWLSSHFPRLKAVRIAY